jgi:carbonic anhydrase/acetyltransferase-like protein (isoleucine patch superfamily)
VPAKVRRQLTDEEMADVRLNAAGYVLLAARYAT